MNEKIKELFKRAGGKTSARNLMSNPVQVVETHELWDDRIEKFAELIVLECCSKLVEMGESWHEFAKNPPGGQAHNASGALFAAYRLKEDAVDEIKEHFGVEE